MPNACSEASVIIHGQKIEVLFMMADKGPRCYNTFLNFHLGFVWSPYWSQRAMMCWRPIPEFWINSESITVQAACGPKKALGLLEENGLLALWLWPIIESLKQALIYRNNAHGFSPSYSSLSWLPVVGAYTNIHSTLFLLVVAHPWQL